MHQMDEMRYLRSHGGTGDSVRRGGAADPSAKHINTERPDVDNGAIVGERSLAVARINSANSVRRSDAGRAGRPSVNVAVASSDREVEASSDRSAHGRVDCSVGTTAEGQVGNRGTATGAGLVVGVVNSGDNV
jgi:hypothetical protein